MSTRAFPASPSLENLKKQAKTLKRSATAGEQAALDRIGPYFGDPRAIKLQGAQLVIAREYGFSSWTKLKAHLETDDNVYKHVWQTGDMIIWDNRCVLHRRGPQEKGRTRVLRRVMAGDGDPRAVRQHLMGYE